MHATVPTLKKCCVAALIKCRRYLGDVGYLDVDSLRDLLFHCSVEELRCIEDMTMEGSDRDLSWYTWHYWLDHYKKKFGSPRAGFQAPPLEAEAPEDYTPPIESEAAADWRRAYFERKEADAAFINRLGQQVKAMYDQAEADKQSKQAQVCVKVQGDRVRRRSAPAMVGVKRPPPPSTPAEVKKSKVLKAIGLKPSSSSSRAPPQGSRKVTITRTITPQPARTLPPQQPRALTSHPHRPTHPHPTASASSNPSVAARLASHSKTSSSYLPTKPPPRPTPNALAHPSKPPGAPQHPQRPGGPSASLQPPSSSRPSYSQPPPKASKPTLLPGTSRPPAPAATSSHAAGPRLPAGGRPPQSVPGGPRPAGNGTAKPATKADLAQMSDAQLEAELARRRRHSAPGGLRIIDDDEY